MLPRRLLGLTLPEGDPETEGVRLVRITGDAADVTPECFLAHAPQAPRSFWQQEDTWRAGVGHAARITVRASESGPADIGAGDDDRFSRVQDRAQRVAERLVSPGEEPIRFHGGFAFYRDHRPRGPWRGFPTAAFAVPSVELVHDTQGTRFHVTIRVPDDVPRSQALEQAENALERVQAAVGPEDPRERVAYRPPRPENSTDRDEWRTGVKRILHETHETALEKAVLARTVDAPVKQEPDPTVVLGNLRQSNPGTNLFLIQPGPGQAFLGAAPELIGCVRGPILEASAVAGSIRRGDDEAEDDKLARRLTTSEKDRAEHEIVVRSMRRRLAQLTDRVEVGRETSILRLSDIQHLERDLFARLGPEDGILDVVRVLHPTPAVCGYPRDEARRLLREIEPFQRGWYAGPVGWFDAEGNGSFAPGLRCAVLQERTWRLFAGAGIVEGSTVDDEWEETRVKFEPVLSALGVPEAPP